VFHRVRARSSREGGGKDVVAVEICVVAAAGDVLRAASLTAVALLLAA
jgi:hypothetical protein